MNKSSRQLRESILEIISKAEAYNAKLLKAVELSETGTPGPVLSKYIALSEKYILQSKNMIKAIEHTFSASRDQITAK